MKFKELDKKLRIYETAYDFCVPPNIFIVARIDGRGFTKLTKELYDFEKPFDKNFRDFMIETVRHLMTCGFDVIYGYTQSDEISLLFNLNENTFSRKIRKYNSILAGEASAKFSTLLGGVAVFDCRISQLPREQDVIDYFRWRNEDAYRNSLNAHCYWTLRSQALSANQATEQIIGKSNAFKNEFLFKNGINFNDLPNWQKRGVGLSWTMMDKIGWNPIQKEETISKRKEIEINQNLPMKDAYNDFILEIMQQKA